MIGHNSQSRISNKKNNGSSSIDPLLAAEVVKQYLLPMFKVSQISNIEILSIKWFRIRKVLLAVKVKFFNGLNQNTLYYRSSF